MEENIRGEFCQRRTEFCERLEEIKGEKTRLSSEKNRLNEELKIFYFNKDLLEKNIRALGKTTSQPQGARGNVSVISQNAMKLANEKTKLETLKNANAPTLLRLAEVEEGLKVLNKQCDEIKVEVSKIDLVLGSLQLNHERFIRENLNLFLEHDKMYAEIVEKYKKLLNARGQEPMIVITKGIVGVEKLVEQMKVYTETDHVRAGRLLEEIIQKDKNLLQDLLLHFAPTQAASTLSMK